MASLTGVDAPIAAFDAARSQLAVATADGRVRLFSVARGRLDADATAALAGAAAAAGPGDVYSALAWGPEGPAGRLLYAGSTGGAVACYDAARGALKWRAAAALDGAVAALAVGAPEGGGAAGRLLAVSRGGAAAVLDAAGGGALATWRASKHGAGAAALLPGGRALVAGAALALHDTASGARLGRLTGHAEPAVALAAAPDGSLAASAAPGERAAAVWSLAGGGKGGLRHKSAVARLPLGAPAAALALAPAAGAPPGAAAFQLAAVTAGGGLRLFSLRRGGDDDAGGVAAAAWAAAPEGAGVLAAALEAADVGGATLVLAMGPAALPTFRRLRADAPAGGAVAELDLGPAAGPALVAAGPAAGGAAKAGRAAAVVAAADGGASLAARFGGAKRPAVDGSDAEDEEDDAAAVEADDMDADDSDEAEEGPTFGERVAALAEAADPGAGGGAEPAAPPPGPLKADSLAVLLSQALRSGDRALLERCLAATDESLISRTAVRLSPADAAALLRACVARLAGAPAARGERAAGWARAAILAHAASLAAAEGGPGGALGRLYQLIEARLASYHPLLALNGRLDLVLANAARAAGAGGGVGADAPNGPAAVYEVGSDGRLEAEDVYGGGASGSEDEWASQLGSEESGSDGSGAEAEEANGAGGSSDEEEESD
jgi:U3 small nucleolar RNA-associated protein 5